MVRESGHRGGATGDAQPRENVAKCEPGGAELSLPPSLHAQRAESVDCDLRHLVQYQWTTVWIFCKISYT